MQRGGTVYIITNVHNRVLYTGVTTDLVARISEHREKISQKGFASRYNVNKLVYYKCFPSIEEAIAEEKRIKGGSRRAKENLIKSINPQWKDLWIVYQHGNVIARNYMGFVDSIPKQSALIVYCCKNIRSDCFVAALLAMTSFMVVLLAMTRFMVVLLPMTLLIVN